MPQGNHRMRFDRMVRGIGPFVAMAALGGLAAAREKGWQQGKWGLAFGPGTGGQFRFNGREGVPLDQLDMGSEAVRQVVLASADHVTVTQGEPFAIAVQGSEAARARVRFVVEDAVLFVLRDDALADWAPEQNGSAGSAAQIATVCVTMSAPDRLTIAGSGDLSTDTLADDAALVIAGSGRLRADGIDLARLSLTVAGSGHVTASGRAGRLEVSVAGSGMAAMAGLAVDQGDVDIAGSGHVLFASNGTVRASIMGSGCVTVRGAARCEVHAMGSGKLVCERPGSNHEAA